MESATEHSPVQSSHHDSEGNDSNESNHTINSHRIPRAQSVQPSGHQSATSRIPPRIPSLLPEDELIDPAHHKDLDSNNLRLVGDSPAFEHRIVLECLRNHPMSTCLQYKPKVPKVYLQQLWHEMYVSEFQGKVCLKSKIDEFKVRISLRKFRKACFIPEANNTAFPNAIDFDPLPEDAELLADIQALGYSNNLPNSVQFHRKYLSEEWYTLCQILFRCLTFKHSGFDKASMGNLRIFHGFAYNRNYDYADLFFQELVGLVKAKLTTGGKRFIPYQRFLQLLIRAIIRNNDNIPKRLSAEKAPDFPLSKIPNIPSWGNRQRVPLSEHLLRYASPAVPLVREYLLSYAPMLLQEPADATQGDQPILGTGGKQERENLERREGAGTARNEDSEHTFTEPLNLGGEGLDVDEIVSKFTEGVEKERAEREKVSKEIQETIQTPESREATSATGLHLLKTSIEEVTVIPPVQSHPTGHLTSSQKDVISTSHGDLAQLLSASHSEKADIEDKGQQPLSLPFDSAQSLEPKDRTLESVTPVTSEDQLRAASGTPIVDPQSGLRGLGGSPATLNIEPGVQTGLDSSSFKLTVPLSEPGVISPNSVSQEYLDKVLQGVVGEMNKSMNAKFDVMTRLLRGKATATIERERRAMPPPPPKEKDHSIDDLEGLLLAKLLSTSKKPTPDQISLIEMLRRRSEQEAVEKSEFDIKMNELETVIESRMTCLEMEMREGFDRLAERMSLLEQTCKAQASTHKRKQDDPDSDDHPEGEKKKRRVEPEASQTDKSGSKDLVLAVVTETATTEGGSTREEERKEAESFAEEMIVEFAEPLAIEFPEPRVEKPKVTELAKLLELEEGELSEGMDDEDVGLGGPANSPFNSPSPSPSPEPTSPKPTSSKPTSEPQSKTSYPFISSSLPNELNPLMPEYWAAKAQQEQMIDEQTEEKKKFEDRQTKELSENERLMEMFLNNFTLVDDSKKSEQLRAAMQVRIQKELDGMFNLLIKKEKKEEREKLKAEQISWELDNERKPFLEDLMPRKIYTTHVLEIDDRLVYDVTNTHRMRLGEYVVMMGTQKKKREEVRSRDKVGFVRDVQCKSLGQYFRFPIIKFTRLNGKMYEISEADYFNMTLEDIEDIYEELKTSRHKKREMKEALVSIFDFMHTKCVLMNVEDFQIGVEAHQRRVNLTAPNRDLPDIDKYALYTVLQKPEPGVIYPNAEKKNQFLRASETVKYSDGTLRMISKAMRDQFKAYQKKKTKDQMTQPQMQIFHKVLDAVEDTLRDRNVIRRFNAHIGWKY